MEETKHWHLPFVKKKKYIYTNKTDIINYKCHGYKFQSTKQEALFLYKRSFEKFLA